MRAKLFLLLVIATAGMVPAVARAEAGFPPFLRMWGGAGSAPGSFKSPDMVTVDLRGDVFVADRENNRVQKFDYLGHSLAVIGRAGGAPGQMRGPRGVAVDGLGDLYVADSGNNRIQKFDPRGRLLAVWGRNRGDGSPGIAPGQFNDPRGIATDAAGDLYVADHSNNRVQELSRSGHVLKVLGRNHGDGTAGTGDGEFHLPRGVTVDQAGDLYVADKQNNRIQKFDPHGRFIARWGAGGGNGTPGNGNGEFRIPYSVAAGGTVLYVADTGNNRLQAFTPDGQFIARLGKHGGDGSPGTGPAEFSTPYGVGLDCRGDLYVSDEGNERIQVFGDPMTAPPACPPALHVGRLSSAPAGNDVRLRVGCDHPCTLHIQAVFREGAHTQRRLLRASIGLGRKHRQLRIALPAAARRAHGHGSPASVSVDVRAHGLGGTTPAVLRQTALRGVGP